MSEAAKPFLDKQLLLFTEATQVASYIANAPTRASAARKIERFWEFGDGLANQQPGSALRGLALDLAHACGDELTISWGTDAWSRTSPTVSR